jgi:hypothetical protein
MISAVWIIMKKLKYKDYKVAFGKIKRQSISNHGVHNLNRLEWKKGQFRHLNIIGKVSILTGKSKEKRTLIRILT